MDSLKKIFFNFEVKIIKYSPTGNQKSNIFCDLQEVIIFVLFYRCSISFRSIEKLFNDNEANQ
jgi:hypothetical protein